MVDTRRSKSNTTTAGPSHGFVVEASLQLHGTVAANALRPPPSASQPPPTAGIAEQQPQTAAGVAEQPPRGPVTCTALQLQAPAAGAALPRPPAVGTQQQPHRSTAGLAAQPYGYFDTSPVLEQIHPLPHLPPHLTYAPVYASNGALAHMPLGSLHTSGQVDLNSRVDQLTQRVDDQNNLIGQLLRQINLNQGPNLGPRDEERRTHEHVSEQLERSQAGQARANGQGRERDRADETQTSASRTLSRSTIRSRLGPRTNVRERLGPQSNVHARLGPQSNVHARLGPQGSNQSRLGSQGARVREQSRDERNDRRSLARSRTNARQQAVEDSSQAQSPNLPHGQDNQRDQPSGIEEEVNQRRTRPRRHRPEPLPLRAEDVEKLVNDRLQSLQLKGSTDEALHKEIAQVDCSPFTDKVERAAPPKRFTTPSITPFKGDSDPESHLRHFKSAMILYKADDALMCKVFAMTLRGAAQDWFHTLPSASIGNFKEFALIFTKEYTSYKTVRKHADHLFNLHKKPDESLRDYLRRFKAEKANIIGCNDQVASSAFKKGLPTEHELYRELAITPSQTLVEVFATAERYAVWDDDRIAAKKASKQADHPPKQASQKSNKFESKARDKRRSRPQEGGSEAGTYTEFTIPIHQILAQVKDKP
ncbi:hypothetical protein CerSpe_277580 [Prunus speciosa]